MMLLYERSEAVTALAYELLLDSATDKLPVDVLHIAEFLNLKVIDNNEVNELDASECGVGIFDGSVWNIVYDSNANLGRIRFTIAHEIGHIVLRHRPESDGQTDELELEADLFAARLLAPICILQELEAYSASSIALLCNISRSSAEIQSRTMVNLLTGRGREYSYVEKKLIESFGHFIKNNRLEGLNQRNIHAFKGGRQGFHKAINNQIRRRKNLDIDD